MDQLKKFWSTELFRVNGFHFTVGVVIVVLALYWFFFMRR